MTTAGSTLYPDLPQGRIQISGGIAKGQMKKGTYFSNKEPERSICCVPRALFALHFLFGISFQLAVNIQSLIPGTLALTASL